jgi:hypothetical protein
VQWDFTLVPQKSIVEGEGPGATRGGRPKIAVGGRNRQSGFGFLPQDAILGVPATDFKIRKTGLAH